MVRLRVVVEPQSPLVLGSGMDSTQNVRESRDYIAGSVVRGALAQVILEHLHIHNTSRRSVAPAFDTAYLAAFNAVFTGASPARFGYLYPAHLQAADILCELFPAPATTLACKTHGTSHPVLDTLWTTLHGDGQRPHACLKCGERVERWRGFVLRRLDGEYDWCKGAPRRPLVRVGLNRWTETAEEGILYVLDAIMPNTEHAKPLAFVGFWTMSEEQCEQLKQLLDQFFLRAHNGYRLRLGSARARGLGEVVLWWQDAPFADVERRLNDFQHGLPDDNYLYFSLTARSPVLVYNEIGLPARVLTSEVLQSYVSTVPSGLELIEKATFIERETVTGWSQAWGLPKPITSTIAAGSVFTYRAPKTEREAVLTFLKEIETNGLGERRSEGFGDLAACEPFHVDYWCINSRSGPMTAILRR